MDGIAALPYARRAADESGLPAPNREGPADAFRHMMASALYAQEYGKDTSDTLGAMFEANYHLKKLNPFASDKEIEALKFNYQMDTNNNRLGAYIGTITSTPEEAANMIMDYMRQSVHQETSWDEHSTDDAFYDDSVPVIWNRQHYKESPDELYSQLSDLKASDFLPQRN